MSRCEYDTIFQRVSCVTLVAIALTFTVILTNVFVDIDGLLTKKDRAQSHEMPEPVLESEHHGTKIQSSPNLIEEFYKEERNDEDIEDNYRSKRSLETPAFLSHVKDPKVKSILTDRLATLLEELDEEEFNTKVSKTEDKRDKTEGKESRRRKKKGKEDSNVMEKFEAIMDNNLRRDGSNKHDTRNEEDMLHLAMHNILLQGIIGHMDLNDVFRKVHKLLKNINPNSEDTAKQDKEIPKDMTEHILKAVQHNPSVEENKFFEELTECNQLQNDIMESKTKSPIEKDTKPTPSRGPKLLIKTIIDITSNKDQTRKDILNSKESIKGIIKLIYNGKSVKFSRMEDEDSRLPAVKNEKLVFTPDVPTTTEKSMDDIVDLEMLPKSIKNKRSFFNQIIDNYLKKYPKSMNEYIDTDIDKKADSKRMKRQIKIKYEDDAGKPSTYKPKAADDDDELYVEIETHFDSKGMKGMKKKKLIRNIIEKIQKAIHSDLDLLNNGKKKKHKHLQVKKRVQNPLDRNKALLLNKIIAPLDSVIKRHSDPISKLIPLEKFSDKSGETWKKSYYGPAYLSASKSVNSAEMGEVDIDYNKILAVNGIPQRLQMPLNTDASEESVTANSYFDMGNLKFFVKNIDGTGLSIGFNQYTDEPPDPDTIKLFTGIENLIQTYNKNNGDEQYNAPVNKQNNINTFENNVHELSKRDVNSKAEIRDETDEDYHSNEYKVIFDNNFIPYDNYQEILEDNKRMVALSVNKEKRSSNNLNFKAITNNKKEIETKILPALMDENIFYKKLKPAEILSLATLLDRKKRSITVKKINDVNKKIKLNRFLNTHAHGRKKIILNKKRSKRQIEKIRIIASDPMSKHRHSEENIFLINDDNVLADRAIIREVADRAIIREVDTPDMVDNTDYKMPEEHYDMVPVVYEEPPPPTLRTNVFGGKFRHNPLMSKYPHIFLEEIGRSREEDTEPIIYNKIQIQPRMIVENNSIQIIPENQTMVVDGHNPKIDELVNALDPKQNYKLTVKIFPRNGTDMHSGFKEIHTSINKTYNKDGLLYSSLVNVSEISKIEKLNNASSDIGPDLPLPILSTQTNFAKHIQEQQNKMDLLLKQHKKRIDEQLDHLKRERMNLDTLTIKTRSNIKPLERTKFDTAEKPGLLQMNKDDVTKFLASALFNLQNKLPTTQLTTPAALTTRTESPTNPTTMTTTPKPPTTTVDPIKLKLLDKIQQNENVTNEILNQIHKNTEILHSFLQKLTDQLSKKETEKKKKEDLLQKSEELRRNLDFSSKFWKPLPPLQATQDTDNPLLTPEQFGKPRNESHFAIPFVYAYQQPYPNPNFKQSIPVASVVYHGHIHAKAYKHQKNIDVKTSKDSIAREVMKDVNNQTSFFIDDLERNFKEMHPSTDSTIVVRPSNVTAL